MNNSHNHINGGTLDYNYIDQGIFIGNNQCCSLGLAEVLEKKKIVADISLEDERLDHPFGVASYLWLPTKDLTPPSKDQFRLGIAHLKNLVSAKAPVYVHCKNGHGRSTTLVVAFFMSQGMTFDVAVNTVKDKRPGVHLDPSQEESLRKGEWA